MVNRLIEVKYYPQSSSNVINNPIIKINYDYCIIILSL